MASMDDVQTSSEMEENEEEGSSENRDDYEEDATKKQEIMQNLQQLNLLQDGDKTFSSRSNEMSRREDQSPYEARSGMLIKDQRETSPLKEPSISDDSH